MKLNVSRPVLHAIDLEEQENAAKKNEVVTDKNAAKRLQEEVGWTAFTKTALGLFIGI